MRVAMVAVFLFSTSFGTPYNAPTHPEVVEMTFDASSLDVLPTTPSISPPRSMEPEHDNTPAPPPTIVETITAAAAEFDQDATLLTRVAFCESSHRPNAIGDGGLAVGLFQFHPDTWREESRLIGYSEDLRADPVASSRVAAFMFSQGLQHRWTCYGMVLARGA